MHDHFATVKIKYARENLFICFQCNIFNMSKEKKWGSRLKEIAMENKIHHDHVRMDVDETIFFSLLPTSPNQINVKQEKS